MPPKFRFSHDLESLWWIALWILIYHVKYPQGLKLAEEVYTRDPAPSFMRCFLLTTKNCSDYLLRHIDARSESCVSDLVESRNARLHSDCDFYVVDIWDPMTYAETYNCTFLPLFD